MVGAATGGYNGELRLEIRENKKTTTWGYLILPLSADPTSTHLKVRSDVTLAANNLIQTESALATYSLNYKTPMVHYTDTAGMKYFYFMSYILSTSVLTTTTSTECPEITVDTMDLRNCWDIGIVEGYKNFVSTGIRTNFSLWIFIALMLLFFGWTNSAENNTPMADRFKDNTWTLHPLYSVWNYGSEQFTKTSRLALWVSTLVLQQFIISIFYKVSVNKDSVSLYTNIFVWAAVTWAISIPISYIFAIPLVKIYQAHREYAYSYRNNKDIKYRDFITDRYEGLKIRLYF